MIKENAIDLSSVGLIDEEIQSISQLYIVDCGSAWHVRIVAQYVFEHLADIPVRVELASGFPYRKMPLDTNTLVIIISQG